MIISFFYCVLYSCTGGFLFTDAQLFRYCPASFCTVSTEVFDIGSPDRDENAVPAGKIMTLWCRGK